MSAEEAARLVAEIIGPNSAASKALAKLEALRAKGRKAELVSHGASWYVMEVPPDEPAALGDGKP